MMFDTKNVKNRFNKIEEKLEWCNGEKWTDIGMNWNAFDDAYGSQKRFLYHA